MSGSCARPRLYLDAIVRVANQVAPLRRLGLALCAAFALSNCGGGGDGGSAGNSAAATAGGTAGNVAGADTFAPAAPTGLAATTASGTSIRLTWSASSDNVGVAGYHVYRSGSNTALATLSGTAHTDSGLAGNTTFSYQVAAFDAAGNTSARSVTSAATTPAAGPPPAGLVSSLKSGAWSDPTVWNSGSVPGAGADIRVSATHEVTYDAQSSPGVHTLLINGVLRFARDRNTVLDVGLIVVSAHGDFDVARAACADHGNHNLGAGPALEVGTRDAPIPAGVTAKIRLLAYADLDANCAPAIVNHGGRMEFHGAPMPQTWTKLAATAAAGTRTLSLAEAVTWKAGDIVIVTATDKRNRNGGEGLDLNGSIANGFALPRTEQHAIAQVSADGRTVTIAAPLAIAHRGGANVDDLRGEVANLSRNVIVESAAPLGVRGHVMYHTSGSGGVSYAEFRHLGKAGTLGRYPLHFHLVSNTMRGFIVQGASIWDSKNRWIAVHGTEYMVVRDTVGYQSLGHGFFLENGSEVNTLFDNNLGVQAFRSTPIPGQVLAYDKNDGACYWAANARNFAFNNVFAECDTIESFTLDYAPDRKPMPTVMLTPDGSRQTVDAATVSGGLVKNLEVHSHFGWGPWIKGGRFPADEPMRFENTKVWDVHYSIDISGDNVVFDGVKIYQTPYGFYNNFAGPHLVRNAYCENVSPHGCFMTYLGGNGTMLYENITVKGTELIFRVDAKAETGANAKPIDVHARNITLLNTTVNGGTGKIHWSGTEDNNSRPSPRAMLVLHDLFGANRDAVVLPATQSPTLPGVPAGLNFVDGGTVTDPRGLDFEGRGATQVAEGNIPWPISPLANPVDRLPPATTITYPANGARPVANGGTLVVRGVSLDQFGVAAVMVNGQAATLSSNGFDWTATLTGVPPGPLRISAEAVDAAGNRERTAHAIDVVVASGAAASAGRRTALARAPFADQYASRASDRVWPGLRRRDAGRERDLPAQPDAIVLTAHRGGNPIAPPLSRDVPPAALICGRADAEG